MKNLQPTCIIKKEYVIHIRKSKQALNHELVLKKVHRLIKFNQEAWLKSYISINAELRKKEKIGFKKDFLKLVNSAVSNVRNVKKCKKM